MNFITTSAKILETPKKKLLKNQSYITLIKIQVPKYKDQMSTIYLILNDRLFSNFSIKVNDYILLKGYLSFCVNTKISKIKQKKQITIVASHIFPFLLKD